VSGAPARQTRPEGQAVRLVDLADPGPALAALEEIFFESAARTGFASDRERREFLARWTAVYLEHYRDDVWLWREGNGAIAGYLTGCQDSAAAGRLYDTIPGYGVFEGCFEAFPAHLHVNCRGDRRGLGIGARLVEAFAGACRSMGRRGLHVVTGPGLRNVRFYDRIGFGYRQLGTWLGRPLLFMGRSLAMETAS
jgi:GNAT superfamily N-acetyltransferase